MTVRVTIVTVSYNSADVLRSMLASLPGDVETVVVDNNSSDASCDVARQAGATVVKMSDNLGFGVACNAGAAQATTDYLLFLNPDAVVVDDAVSEMVRVMDAHPDCAACNPKIRDARGRPAFKRRSVLLPRRAWAPRGWPPRTQPVAVLTGSAFFVRRAAFEAVGGFDRKIFLYHEDDDLALRLDAACGPLLFVATATVEHLGGHSSARSPEVAAWKSYQLARSRVYAMRKHQRPLPFVACFLTAVMKCLSPSALLSRRKRAQAFGFMRGVLKSRRP